MPKKQSTSYKTSIFILFTNKAATTLQRLYLRCRYKYPFPLAAEYYYGSDAICRMIIHPISTNRKLRPPCKSHRNKQ
jgi:hypothetical protein